MARLPAVKLGDGIRVVFDDHTENQPDLGPCEVWGRVAGKNRRQLTIVSWGYVDGLKLDGDTTYFTIARSTIREIEIFRRATRNGNQDANRRR